MAPSRKFIHLSFPRRGGPAGFEMASARQALHAWLYASTVEVQLDAAIKPLTLRTRCISLSALRYSRICDKLSDGCCTICNVLDAITEPPNVKRSVDHLVIW